MRPTTSLWVAECLPTQTRFLARWPGRHLERPTERPPWQKCAPGLRDTRGSSRRTGATFRSDVGCSRSHSSFLSRSGFWFQPASPRTSSRLRPILRQTRKGSRYGKQLNATSGVGPRGNSSGAGMTEGAARYGPPTLVLPRLGQGTFRVIVRDNYDRRCAVTGERTLPALDAAHIRPYAEGGLHAASNGILFRRDIHSLFDAGYVTVTKDRMFEVSRRIREEFENGRHYYAMHGTPLSVPDRADRRPDPRMLEWHNTARFRG